MSTKTIGIIVIVIGVLGLLVSLLADYIGLGVAPAKIGPRQLGAAGISLVVIIMGIVLSLRKKKS